VSTHAFPANQVDHIPTDEELDGEGFRHFGDDELPPVPPPAEPQLPELWRQAGSLTLTLPAGLSRQQLISVGRELAGIARGFQWWIGDWRNYIERSHGEAATIAAEAFPNKTLGTIKTYGSVAAAFDSSSRLDDLSFSHHQAVQAMPHDLRLPLLEQARANDWAVPELREEVARRRAEIPAQELNQVGGPPVQPKAHGTVDPLYEPNFGEPPANIGETVAPPVPTNTIYAGGVQPPPPPPKAPYLGVATNNPEYNTPAQYVDMARRVLGRINTDPASNEEAQKVVRAEGRYYTKDNSGLGRPWFGPVWLNPPCDLIELFVRQLIDEHLENRAKTAIMLCHNATETVWYQDMLEQCAAFCLPKGRIQYTDTQPIRGNTFFYLGNGVDKFANVFSEVGPVVRVYRKMKS
jgi:hypothetical protein